MKLIEGALTVNMPDAKEMSLAEYLASRPDVTDYHEMRLQASYMHKPLMVESSQINVKAGAESE